MALFKGTDDGRLRLYGHPLFVQVLEKERKKVSRHRKARVGFKLDTQRVLRTLHLTYTIFFQIVIGLSFVTWFVMEGTAYFLDEDRRSKNQRIQVIWNFAMVVGALAIIAGSILNILNWGFAIPLLVIGITIIAAYILKDVFNSKKIDSGDPGNEEFQL